MVSEPNSVIVFATGEQGTLAALQQAALVHGARTLVLVPYCVSHGSPLAVPPEEAERLAASYRDLALRVGLHVDVRVGACREARHLAGRLMLKPSRILIGGARRSWYPTREQQLARELACDGHDITFVDVRSGQPMSAGVAVPA